MPSVIETLESNDAANGDPEALAVFAKSKEPKDITERKDVISGQYAKLHAAKLDNESSIPTIIEELEAGGPIKSLIDRTKKMPLPDQDTVNNIVKNRPKTQPTIIQQLESATYPQLSLASDEPKTTSNFVDRLSEVGSKALKKMLEHPSLLIPPGAKLVAAEAGAAAGMIQKGAEETGKSLLGSKDISTTAGGMLPPGAQFVAGEGPIGKSEAAQKIRAPFVSIKNKIVSTLSYVENKENEALRKKLGLPPNKNFDDNTYAQTYIDLGVNPWVAHPVGFVSAIYTDPLFIVGSGVSRAAKTVGRIGKILGEEVYLSNWGRKAMVEIAKLRADALVKSLNIESGKVMSIQKENRLRENQLSVVREEFLDRFSELRGEKARLKVGEDVSEIGKKAFDLGGLKLKPPPGAEFVANLAGIKFGEMTLIEGRTIAKAAAPLVEATAKLRVAAGAIPYEPLAKATTGLFDKVKAGAEEAKRMWSDNFIHHGLLDYDQKQFIIETQMKAEHKRQQIVRIVSKFLSPLDNKEQRILGRELLENSYKQLGENIQSKSGNPKIQDLMDQWYGQGKYEGKRNVKELFAKFQKLPEELKTPFGYPAILRGFEEKILPFKFEFIPAERKFNVLRGEIDMKKFTWDPVVALSHRLTEATFANIQDEAIKHLPFNPQVGIARFEKAAEATKAGFQPINVKKFKTVTEAIKAGYVPLTRRMNEFTLNKKDEIEAFNKEGYWIKEELHNALKELGMRQTAQRGISANPFVKVYNGITSLWKEGVTRLHPAYHARNLRSTTVTNFTSIGGYTLHPEVLDASNRMMLGAGLDKVYTNALGVKKPLKQIIKDMDAAGITNNGFYVKDLYNERSGQKGNDFATLLLQDLNPLSPRFKPSKALPHNMGQFIGNVIENYGRFSNGFHWWREGIDPRVAKLEVDAAHFDYATQTSTDALMKIFFPFYTYSRRNFDLQSNILVRDPGTLFSQLYFFHKLGPTKEEWEKGVPDYLKSQVVLKYRNMLYSGLGLQVEDFFETLDHPQRKFMTMVNPLFSMPFEAWSGKDFYSGRRLNQVRNAQEFEGVLDAIRSDWIPQVMKDYIFKPLRDFFKLKEVRVERTGEKPFTRLEGDPTKLFIMRHLATSRFQSMLAYIQDNRPDIDNSILGLAWRFMLGINRIPYDAHKKASHTKWMRDQDYQDAVERSGVTVLKNHATYIGVPDEERDAIEEEEKAMFEEGLMSPQIEERYQRALEEVKRRETQKIRRVGGK